MPPTPSAKKTCSKCTVPKPLADFPPRKGAKDGHRNVCIECTKKAKRASERRIAARRSMKTISEATHATLTDLANSKWPSVDAFERESADDIEVPVLDTSGFDLSDVDAVETERARIRRERELLKLQRERDDRARRQASDFDAMRPEDFTHEFKSEFDTSVSNNHDEDPIDKAERSRAAKEKRQEFNRRMGEFGQDLRDAAVATSMGAGSIGENMPAHHAEYIASLAEQERRFGNRRWARSISIQQAQEQLSREAMMYVAEKYFSSKIEPTGYARFAPPDRPMKRTACVLLSDLHLGSELDSLDEPMPFMATQEARRLEYILRQFLDYKPQYREDQEALVILNGDLIEGNLLHDLRSGAPLTEQKAIYWSYMREFIALVAQQYKKVRVECQPGNHGRDKLRHPGRATSAKWDGHEWSINFALKMMCSDLQNVTWSMPFQAISIVDVHGQTLGVTHADTELKLGDPDTKAKENFGTLSKINSTNIYRAHFDGWVFGHYHKGRYQPGNPSMLWNGPLVPPNGHARTAGYIGEQCGQWIWEAVEGHLFGDARFIAVGESQDNDERLGTLIKPFRFKEGL